MKAELAERYRASQRVTPCAKLMVSEEGQGEGRQAQTG